MIDDCPKAATRMAMASIRAAEEDVYTPIKVDWWPFARLVGWFLTLIIVAGMVSQ